jgi:hypothetical protein
MSEKKLCAKCVLPASTPGISFDDKGICSYCNSYEPMKVKGEEELIKILNKFKAKKKKYDCMLCISGGRDSSYTLWKLVNDYKMKVLAVNYKNPFTSEQARVNMRKSLELLKVDFVDWDFPNCAHEKATGKALKAWSHNPTSILIPIVCAHCKSLWPTFFKIANENDIALIIIGSNPLETASFKKAGLGGARTYHKLSNLPRILLKSMRELIKNPRYLISCSWSRVIKMYLMSSHSAPYLKWRYKNIEVVRLFDYLKWNEKEVMSTIKEKLGWQQSAEVASPWRFDCRLDYVRRLMYASTTGVTELRDLFSKMIREGIITRDEALKRLQTEDVISVDVANDVLKDIGIQLPDLNLKLDEGQIR